MSRIRPALFAIALAVGCTPAEKADSSPPASNGADAGSDPLSTVVLPDPQDPAITYMAWFQVGSQDDPPGKEGLASLTGQLIARGGTSQRSYREILEAMYPLATSYSVRVDREMTTLRGRTHVDNREAFEQLFTQAYLSPAFDPADFERVRQDALNRVKRSLRYAQDEELGKAVLLGTIFDGTPYRHPSTGTVAGLESITLDDVKQFYATHYTRDRLVFALAGGFDDSVRASIEGTRDELPETGADRIPAPQPKKLEGRSLTIVDKPGADASISMGFPIDVHRGEKDYYALWIANSWLGEHRNSSSHLYQVIRATRGLNYGDYSYIEAFPQGGFRQMPPTNVGRRQQIFEIWIRTLPNEHAHFALRAAVRELEDLVNGGMTPEEFELTREFLGKYVLHYADTASTRLGFSVDDRFYGLDEPHLQRFRRMMSELTVDDVNAAIKRHLQVDDMAIALVTGEAAQLQKAIVEDAPSSVTYTSPKPEDVMKEDEIINAYPLKISSDKVRVIPVDSVFAE